MWYENDAGTIIPAFNLFKILFGLLTFDEEHPDLPRDAHGRFNACFSPRHDAGLMDVPIFNNAAAVLVSAAMSVKYETGPHFCLQEFIKPPVVILSHDVDNLIGNDVWTQGIRLYRFFRPLCRRRLPDARQLYLMSANALSPEKFYSDDVGRYVKLEAKYKYSSSFYFLSGTKGRFGARSHPDYIRKVRLDIPDGWNLGMHYNYDTHLDSRRFSSQLAELDEIYGFRPFSGRAHYLRFDPSKTFDFLVKQNMKCDESAGYSEILGYRCGIAGPFNPYCAKMKSAQPIWEIPLTIMDQALVKQYPMKPLEIFNRMLNHISKVGGSISILFHTGTLQNPEFGEMSGLYERILESMTIFRAVGKSCAEFLGLPCPSEE
jgi:hypothetical protein